MHPADRIGELFLLGFDGPAVPAWLRRFAERHGLGGVLLFDYDLGRRAYERNVLGPEQLAALCAEVHALPGAPLVFVDQEGGKVRRLKEQRGFAPLPSARAFATLPRAGREALARASYAEMHRLGINVTLAPVVDLDLNPDNPDIGAVERAFSAEPGVVRENAALLGEVARETGLGLCLKHYPGLGGARTDSHQELTRLEAPPPEQLALFHELAPRLPGGAVLVSHGVVDAWAPDTPACLAEPVVRRLREAAPDTLILSDDLQMRGLQAVCPTGEACRRGLAAGLDLLVIGNNLRDEQEALGDTAAALAAAVRADDALARHAADALGRVRARKEALGQAQPNSR